MIPILKNTATGGNRSAGRIKRVGRISLTPLYTKTQELEYIDLPNDEIDWHLRATQALRRAYKFYDLHNYRKALQSLQEFLYCDLINHGCISYGGNNDNRH